MARSRYASLLKEAISEFDTSKSVDVKGPMLDPILGYDGGGALQTKKDMNIPGILERFYFEETAEKLVEHTDNTIDEVPGKEDGNVHKSKKDFEKEITEMTESEEGEKDEKDDKEDDKDDKEETSDSEKVEEAVIEKLIAEMEQEGSESEAGNKAAGTGTVEKQIPDRKDATNEDSIIETLMKEMDDEAAGEEEEEMDVDKELGEVSELGPIGNPSRTDEDELLGEAFEIFKEQIESEDDDIEDEDVIV